MVGEVVVGEVVFGADAGISLQMESMLGVAGGWG